VRRNQTRRGFLLVHVILMLPLAALVLLILGQLMLDALYLQRVAIQHANIVAVGDSLTQQLRQDAWAARSYRRSEDSITLSTVGPDGARPITYTFEPADVRRTAPGGDERAWHCWRLRFDWRIESGPRGDVLVLEQLEAPPPRATAVLPRSFPTTFLLPPIESPAGAPEEPGP
jgi:hypothetical protein